MINNVESVERLLGSKPFLNDAGVISPSIKLNLLRNRTNKMGENVKTKNQNSVRFRLAFLRKLKDYKFAVH